MHFFVYIIYSPTLDKYYIGYSHNPEERVIEHNAGATKSTRSGRPRELVYTEGFKDKTEAIKRERKIKGMKSRKYIENLISLFSTSHES